MAGTENMSEPKPIESQTRGGSCAPAPCSASVVEYKILYDEDADTLGQEVSRAMADGWKPVGGVAVAQSDYYSEDHKGYSVNHFSRVFAQAMTLTPNADVSDRRDNPKR